MLKRHPDNPLITPAMVNPSHPEYRVRGVFNPGATLLGDEVILLLRVAEDVPAEPGSLAVPVVRFDEEAKNGNPRPGVLRFSLADSNVQLRDTREVLVRNRLYLTTLSHLRIARSRDGVHFTVDEAPFLFPADPSESFGLEDARITRIGDTWWINYTCVSPDGFATALASTSDFRSVKRHGIIFHPENKDVCLFPERVSGCYHALHRPNNQFGLPSIWHAKSPDLIHWGQHRCLLRPRDTPWESQRIGGGAPPLRTPEGWLHLYHGKGPDLGYSLFSLLLDLEDPGRILHRGETPLLTPEAPCETAGFFGRVVFTNGLVQRDGHLFIYYGAGDESTCLAETTVAKILS